MKPSMEETIRKRRLLPVFTAARPSRIVMTI
jgi:hypothetical protein